MDNKSSFFVNQYDDNIRKVIPFYDEIYRQVFDVIDMYFGHKALSVLDTGCGTGTFGLRACETLNLSKLILCDPSQKMIDEAKRKLNIYTCEFNCIGSENLDYEEEFDLVTAIQSHHYFDKATRRKAVFNCFKSLKPKGMFIYFENIAPNSEAGKEIMLKRLEKYEFNAGRNTEEIKSHSERYNKEYFPITISEHFEVLENSGFQAYELFWHSYMQSGFYAIKL